jgi:hypothetical protein
VLCSCVLCECLIHIATIVEVQSLSYAEYMVHGGFSWVKRYPKPYQQFLGKMTLSSLTHQQILQVLTTPSGLTNLQVLLVMVSYTDSSQIGHPSNPGKPVALRICPISGPHATGLGFRVYGNPRCGSASVAARTRHFEDLSDLRTVKCTSMRLFGGGISEP